jgi:hypothetical protein
MNELRKQERPDGEELAAIRGRARQELGRPAEDLRENHWSSRRSPRDASVATSTGPQRSTSTFGVVAGSGRRHWSRAGGTAGSYDQN